MATMSSMRKWRTGMTSSRWTRVRLAISDWADRVTGGNRLGKVLLVFPPVAALVTLVAMLWMAGLLDPGYYREIESSDLSDGTGLDLFFVGMIAYNLLPAVALWILIGVYARQLPKGLPVIAAGAVAMTAATVLLLVGTITDESSTAALGLLVYPVLLGLLLVPFAGVAALMHSIRTRPTTQ
jgi:hypothetical protein